MRSFLAIFSKKFKGSKAALSILMVGFAMFFSGSPAYSQTPVISGFEPQKANYGAVVTITGTSFAATTDLRVAFGSVAAEVVASTPTSIQVKVPAGASYAPITVTNLPSGLIAFTSRPFLLSFGGQENGAGQFAPSVSLSGSGIFDLCACDLDGDGKNDLVGSSEISNTINTFLNKSTIGTLSFPIRKDISLGSRSLYISCGDLNGDGKPDLVYTGNATDGSKVIILKNTSTLGSTSFAAPQVLTVSNKTFAKPAIYDLDLDGKAEIILTDRSSNQLVVFKNSGSGGNISFGAAPLFFSLPSASNQGLRIKDVNMDGLADVTVSNLYGNKVFFLLNKSTPGAIGFESPIEQGASVLSNHELEDLDGDGKNDLITLDYQNNKANIYLNNGSGGSLSFAAAKSFATGSKPIGMELGDLNGDEKVDILIGHNLEGNAYLYYNTSTPGSLSFELAVLPATGKLANVQISDMDGDARPDILAADKEGSLFHIFRNSSCIYPKIRPSGTVELCEGSSLTLSTLQSPLAEMATPLLSYQWTKNGAPVGNSHSLEVSSPGVYTVAMALTDGCSTTAEAVTVSSYTASLGNPVFDVVESSCEGQPLTLSVSPASEGAIYSWTNGNGFQQSSTSNSITIAAADPNLHAGVFNVTIAKGSCELSLQSKEISIFPKPSVSISTNGSLDLCAGESVMLQAEEGFATYQWKKDGTPLTAAIGATYAATESGSYTVEVTNSNNCKTESEATEITIAKSLEAAFDAPEAACVDQPVQFSDQSTLEAGKSVSYLWDFGDGTQSTEPSPSHTYSQTGTSPYLVTLMVKYENTNCSSTSSRSIIVQDAAGISLEVLGATELCAGDSTKVQVNGEVAEVRWSNGDNGLSTYAKQGGSLEAAIITTSGCTLTKTVNFTSLSAPELQLSASKTSITLGETVQLQASGGISYSWEPAESLDVPTIGNPLASPTETTTYKVTTWGENGCVAVGEITIEVSFSFVVEIPKLFIPANDHNWKVTNIENYPGVSVHIMNKFGKTVFAAAPYQNDWTADQLKDGVYFYVFKDETGKILKSGSITLIR